MASDQALQDHCRYGLLLNLASRRLGREGLGYFLEEGH